MSSHPSAERIRLILLDVDGVLTDGTVILHADGSESKQFDIKDGLAIVWAQRVGITVGFLSARSSPSTARRAAQLGVTLVHQGVPNKLDAFRQIVNDLGTSEAAVAYMGDDLVDLPVLTRAGLSAAPADAAGDVLGRVHWVSAATGGHGAVRELVELILRAQRRWDAIVESYLGQAPPGEQIGPNQDAGDASAPVAEDARRTLRPADSTGRRLA